jgi:ferredoxin
MLIVHCPLCDNVTAQQTLEQYKVTVESNGEQVLGGLCAYQCPVGHVFFIREADLKLVRNSMEAA